MTTKYFCIKKRTQQQPKTAHYQMMMLTYTFIFIFILYQWLHFYNASSTKRPFCINFIQRPHILIVSAICLCSSSIHYRLYSKNVSTLIGFGPESDLHYILPTKFDFQKFIYSFCFKRLRSFVFACVVNQQMLHFFLQIIGIYLVTY